MRPSMRLLLDVNMKVNGLVLLKKRSLVEKLLIEAEKFKNQNMNIQTNQPIEVITFFRSTLVEKVVIL
jgi:hypothetical protein